MPPKDERGEVVLSDTDREILELTETINRQLSDYLEATPTELHDILEEQDEAIEMPQYTWDTPLTLTIKLSS